MREYIAFCARPQDISCTAISHISNRGIAPFLGDLSMGKATQMVVPCQPIGSKRLLVSVASLSSKLFSPPSARQYVPQKEARFVLAVIFSIG